MKRTVILTEKYRIKDRTSREQLCCLSGTTTYVWNYINDLNKKKYKQFKHGGQPCKMFSAFELNNLTKGCSKELGIAAQTIQAVCEQYVDNRNTAKLPYLRWRSRQKSLGWIPIKSQDFRVEEDTVFYMGAKYKIYKHRQLPDDAKIKTGSFNQDSRGRWFVNIQYETSKDVSYVHPKGPIGIDLGISDLVALSDGTKFHREDLTKKYSDKLATAQRANKKKQVSKIQNKIANCRKDFAHKTTTIIAKTYSDIYIGDVSSQNIIDKGIKSLTKGVYDAAWYQIKLFLEYKAEKLGGSFQKVNEAYSTQTCNFCREQTGPKGLSDLNIKSWTCPCGQFHDRNTNAAINILAEGTVPFSISKDFGQKQKASVRKQRNKKVVSLPFRV